MIHRRIGGGTDLLCLHRANPSRYPFLLQSVAGHPQSGRYDILFAFPGQALELRDGELSGPQSGAGGFLRALNAWAETERAAAPAPDGLPFAGGWFLFCAYELGAEIEDRVTYPAAPGDLPQALAVRVPAAVVHDRETGAWHLLAEHDAGQIERMLADIETLRAQRLPEMPLRMRTLAEEPPEKFIRGVEAIREYLAAGDAFQVNLSRAWQVDFEQRGHELAVCLYDRLRRHNPAPFAGLMWWRDAAVLSSSPERLVCVNERVVQTRPIAGTRPRGADSCSDQALRAELIDSVKERAEHIMLIDLERNDLGRVCEPGSVRVSELMALESYAHVHHIVSNVTGRLRAEVGPGDVIRAVFPGGTITGCPKVRSMQIIAELEGEGRGAYTGSMGYLGRNGQLDCNILIRSLALCGRRVWLRAGAGIVADSQPAAELAETRAKARGLLLSLGVTP